LPLPSNFALDLHPALSDMLLEAAQEVHGGAQPSPAQGEIPPRLSMIIRSAPKQPVTTNLERAFSIAAAFWMATWSIASSSLCADHCAIDPALRVIPPVLVCELNCTSTVGKGALLAVERDH